MSDRGKRLIYLFLFLFMLIILRLAYLQIIKHGFYKKLSASQQIQTEDISPERGDIFDRNGSIFAASLDKWSVYVRPNAIHSSEAIQQKLIDASPENAGLVREKFAQGRNFWLKRKAEKAFADKVSELKCTGIDIVKEKKRVYPKGHLASQLLGFVGIDNQGLSGIELELDSYLSGTPGKYVFERDIKGREIVVGNSKEIIAPTSGMNVFLTIDEPIQYVAQRELEAAVKKNKAISGTITVMDVTTGDILAIAGYPDFDPNEPSKFPAGNIKLSPVTDMYEPGSTFKIITATAGIAEGLVQPDSVIPVPDFIKIGPHIIKNSHKVIRDKPFKTLRDVMAESLNTGTSYIGMKLGKDRFLKYIEAFGFGQRTGIDYPGEPRGMVKTADKWQKVDEATFSFGQSISVTPIQLIRAAAAIANGGQMMKLRLIKKIESTDGETVRSFEPLKDSVVISKDTDDKIKELMKGAVYMPHSSGRFSRIPQFTIAGKTGTAQKVVNGVYSRSDVVASFVGFAPLNDPRIAILVTINEPRTSQWGEVVAAPAFKNVGEFTLRYLNISPNL